MAEVYPQIKYRFPEETAGDATGLRPNIIIDWNDDIDSTQFSNPHTRAQIVMLVDDSTGDQLETEYVSYTASSMRLILKPAADLDFDNRYRVFFRKGVKSTFGRSSRTDYNWYFTTAPSSLDSVELLSPANFNLLDFAPNLLWTTTVSVSGNIKYRLQVDTRFDFTTPFVNVTVPDNNYQLHSLPAAEQTYYWRVCAFTTTVTGSWSDIWSFYYGSKTKAHESSKVTYADVDSFGISRTGFDNGASNQSTFPVISFTFTNTPASSYSNYITVLSYAQIPRNDVSTDDGGTTVAGTWSLSGKTATFTPTDAIGTNTRYEITIDEDLVDTNGDRLGERGNYYFTGPYSPMYTTSRAIRARFRTEGLNLPEDYINFTIYRAGLTAQLKFRAYIQGIPGYLTNSITESLVRDSAALTTFGVGKYTEALVTYELLNSILIDEARNIGRTRKLADYSEGVTKDLLEALKFAMQKAKEELDEWTEYLIPSGVPEMVSPHSLWNPWNRLNDWSLRDIEGRRTPDMYREF